MEKKEFRPVMAQAPNEMKELLAWAKDVTGLLAVMTQQQAELLETVRLLSREVEELRSRP